MSGMVRQFMTTFDQEIFSSPDFTPCEVCILRSKLITEEAKEFSRAKAYSTDELDAICDSLYVILGTNITMSVPLIEVKTKATAPFWPLVLEVTQDLDSRFPCMNIQIKALGALAGYFISFAEDRGYKLLPAFKAVHCANMGKLWTKPPENTDKLIVIKKGDLYLVKREDGKVVKPDTFVAPDLTEFL